MIFLNAMTYLKRIIYLHRFGMKKDQQKNMSTFTMKNPILQELEYLRRVQKYLLFIGMKDLETRRTPVSRYRNKKHSKYENSLIYKFGDDALKKIMSGERNFRVIEWYPECTIKTYKPKEYQALIVDNEDNFKMYVEFTHEEVKLYKDIKSICKSDELKVDDKVIVSYFKILETF